MSSIGFFLFISCGSEDDVSPIPEIAFIGFDKDTLNQSFFNEDTINLALSFVDGDGDLNSFEGNDGAKLVITDLRTNEIYDRFLLPDVPTRGVTRGEMFIRLFTTCCIFPDNIPPCEVDARYPTNDLTLSVTLIDGQGNLSNTIETAPIILKCN